MRGFKSLFILEAKKIASRRNIILLLCFLVLLIALLLNEISEYRNVMANKIDFQESEKQRIEQYVLYTQYGGYGFRILFIPAPMSMLFPNPRVNDMVSSINVAERLSLSDDLTGQSLSPTSTDLMNFTGIILLVFSLLALFYGADSYDRDYLKFLVTLSKSHRKIFFMLFLARVIILNLLFLIMVSCSLLCLLFNGIDIFNIFFFLFLLVAMLTLTFFLVLGLLIGTLKQKPLRVVAVFVVYFVFIFLLPAAVGKIPHIKSGPGESRYSLELKKLKIVMSLEEKSLERIGIYRSGEVAPDKVKELLSNFIKGEYRKLNLYEDSVRSEITAAMNRYHTIASFFPSSFYLSFMNEISSGGYKNFVGFYAYTQEMKQKFFDFYIKKKFYEKSEPGKIESFIKDDENLFSGNSRLPGGFIYGILLNILYIVVLFAIVFYRSKKILFIRPLTIREAKKPIALENGQCRVILTASSEVKEVIYNYFSGYKSGYAGQILMNGKDVKDELGDDYLYICHPDRIPGEFKVKDFLNLVFTLAGVSQEQNVKSRIKDSFAKKFTGFGYVERVEVLLLICESVSPRAVLFDEVEKDMPESETEGLVKSIRAFKSKGTAILYFTRSLTFGSKIYDGDFIILAPPDHIKL